MGDCGAYPRERAMLNGFVCSIAVALSLFGSRYPDQRRSRQQPNERPSSRSARAAAAHEQINAGTVA
jgi:hypothetical protein